MQRQIQVQAVNPALFASLWAAQMSGDQRLMGEAAGALKNDSFAVGAPYYDPDDDSGYVGAQELIGNEEDIVRELTGGDPRALVGLEELVGAAVRRAVGGQPSLPASRTMVAQREPERKRILMCPFGPNVILTGVTSNITAQPQDLFRPDRLVVPSDLAFFFAFTEFKIGQKSALTVQGEVPCAAFTEPAWGIKILTDTSNIGNIITISAKNIDASTRTFRAVLIGTAAV